MDAAATAVIRPVEIGEAVSVLMIPLVALPVIVDFLMRNTANNNARNTAPKIIAVGNFFFILLPGPFLQP